jgi:hypothetical protein
MIINNSLKFEYDEKLSLHNKFLLQIFFDGRNLIKANKNTIIKNK